MRVVLQRVSEAKVTVDQEVVGQINRGFMLLVGITHEDTLKDADYLAEKIAGLRVFEDEAGKMNNSIMDVGGAILSVSQFTLYGDTRKGKRPNFMAAARPDVAEPLYAYFNEQLRSKGLIVETGKFGAMMDVALNNDGPVTLILESKV
ncbi:D-tyrosyl-tRNA(Tyr) deacylase [Paenibacillus sp. TCA20]|uniref:D-aminoacyl-tRNA deacylase n=1 Tax=Paenibacillus urinalis TaxID=521520 RepID=A0AAX3MWK8_9BACL|nr:MULTISPECIES: D-aminoacyl-tRNA deacylase [Paenibacillus]WDH81776.1 D-aminoacyl-tRNA deacylase [Paenibacillus urinalis]GAK42286.1 D-tyrosyl-tRNA(Tyr) deacylase [Paenibacillus sp. TCA20]